MRQIDADALKTRFVPKQYYPTEEILNKIDTAPTIEPQAARLMTLEEVHDMAWDYCYLEEEVIKDNVLQKYCGKHRVKCITWPSIASCVLTFGDEAYGKRWRCWTQRPTDEQREAEKWID